MKLEITRTIEQRETIEIELPYYYKQVILLDDVDCVIYGKIEEKQCTTILVRDDYCRDAVSFEFGVEKRDAASAACYMTDEYRSNEAAYLAAKARLRAAAQDA